MPAGSNFAKTAYFDAAITLFAIDDKNIGGIDARTRALYFK